MPFHTIEEAIEDIRQGRIVIVVDDEDRENEGDFTVAAEKVSPETINFMAKYGRGLICLAMTGGRLDQLQLPLMVEPNTSKYGTAFTISIDARHGILTGISAADRAVTILAAVDPKCAPFDLVKPGHVFPLRARPGGVLERAGQTEAAVDLARLAGLQPAGVICEIMNEDGTMARVPQLQDVAKQQDLKMITVADLIAFRLRTETFVHKVAEGRLQTGMGEFRVMLFENTLDHEHHIALVKGEICPEEPALVRVQSQSTIDDVFVANLGEGDKTLQVVLKRIQQAASGIFVYLRQEGKGADIVEEVRALSGPANAPAEKRSTRDSKGDPRVYGIGAQILRQLGVSKIRLLTDHPRKLSALHGYGLTVMEQIPLLIAASGKRGD